MPTKLTATLALTIALALPACGADAASPAGSDPDAPVSAPAGTSTTAPAATRKQCRRVSRTLVGRRVGRAAALARDAGCGFRVVSRDGVDLPVTEDHLPTRINVRVEAGRVSAIAGLY